MMWWIAALLFLILALDVIVKSTGAFGKTAISNSTEFIGAVADNGSVPTHEFGAFGGNVSRWPTLCGLCRFVLLNGMEPLHPVSA